MAAPVFWWAFSFHRPPDPGYPLTAFLLVAFAIPIVEEAVFRGVIQGLLRARMRAVWAIVATSVLFSAMHLATQSPVWAAAEFVPSLVFGHFRERHGTLASPMILHCWYNAGFFWLFG